MNCDTGQQHALHRTHRHLFFGVILLILLVCAATETVRAESIPDLAREFFPHADRTGEFEGEPPAAPVYREGELLGYVLRTTDVVRIPAYSGEPITLLVGFDLAGSITGLEVISHAEPILVVGVSEEDLKHYADQYRGVSVLGKVKIGGAPREGYVTVDGITGATITAMVMNATVMRAVQKVAEPPRDVLKSLPGIELLEMERNRANAWCCGAGAGVSQTNVDLALWTANERLKEAAATGANALVTACPWCERNFNDAVKAYGEKIEIYDIAEIVHKAL